MKKILIYCSAIFLISCSPKLRSRVIKIAPPLPDNELVVVLDVSDNQVITELKIGELKSVDNGFSERCTYYESIENLKKLAQQAGANLIKIVKQKDPDKWSSCYRLWAEAYRTQNPKKYETQIVWSANRKLTWGDFKGKPDLENYPNALAITNSGFGYESGIQLFKQGRIFIQSNFNTLKSWVLPEGKTDYILNHEQIHFDITEIYSRKLRKELSDAKVTAENPLAAKRIFDKVFKELTKRQETYDNETKHGSKIETQKNWKAIVEIELAKYDLYKHN